MEGMDARTGGSAGIPIVESDGAPVIRLTSDCRLTDVGRESLTDVSPPCRETAVDSRLTGSPNLETRTPVGSPTFRPYQRAAIAAVAEQFRTGVTRTLVTMATGTGKTICFAAVVGEHVAHGERALILAHRSELLDQAAAKLRVLGLEVAIEQADKRAGNAAVVVASVQSLQGRGFTISHQDAFGLIVIEQRGHSRPAHRGSPSGLGSKVFPGLRHRCLEHCCRDRGFGRFALGIRTAAVSLRLHVSRSPGRARHQPLARPAAVGHRDDPIPAGHAALADGQVNGAGSVLTIRTGRSDRQRDRCCALDRRGLGTSICGISANRLATARGP